MRYAWVQAMVFPGMALMCSNTQVIPFFNPRLDDWDTHFDWYDVTLIAKTEIGRVTIQALDLNHESRIRIRRAEQLFGLVPPDRTSE